MNKEVKEILNNIKRQNEWKDVEYFRTPLSNEDVEKLLDYINQLENKYNKALELLVDFNLPCERQMFMDRYSEWCELNCSVSDECYKRCWNKYIEVELEKSKSE